MHSNESKIINIEHEIHCPTLINHLLTKFVPKLFAIFFKYSPILQHQTEQLLD